MKEIRGIRDHGSGRQRQKGFETGVTGAQDLRVVLTPNSKHAPGTCLEYRLVIFPS